MAITEKFSTSLASLNTKSRYGIITGLIIIVLLFVWSLYLIFYKEYEVLFADLEPRDAAVILADLNKNKVAYKLADNGSKILVEKNKVYETRLKIVNNVPTMSGGVGFEIFDKDDFGTTEFAQKINYQRALQGELARTIMSLNEVKFARVHLVLPSSSIFKRKGAESQASVTLVLKNGAKLTQEQVSGIQKLVASSTPGLKTENVTILDQKGVTLAASDVDEHHLADASKKLQRKQEIEKYLTDKAQMILNQTFKNDEAFVTIDVALDFNNIKKTREQVISPEQKDENVALKKEMQMKGNKRDLADTTRSSVEVQYQLGKEIEEIVSTPGSIKRMSIAIVTPAGLTQSQIDYAKSIVAGAVGYDAQRGDSIAVTTTMMASADAMIVAGAEAGMDKANQENMEIANETAKYENKYLQMISAGMARLVHFMSVNPVLSFTLLTVFALLLFYTGMKGLFSRRDADVPVRRHQSITDDEKNRLLSELKEWLAAEKA